MELNPSLTDGRIDAYRTARRELPEFERFYDLDDADALIEQIRVGNVPWMRKNKSLSAYIDRFGRERVAENYGIQAFFKIADEVAGVVDGSAGQEFGEPYDPVGVLRMKATHERTLAQNRGKPSATDGSKGQWRTWNTHSIRACEWFLGSFDGETVWSDDD